MINDWNKWCWLWLFGIAKLTGIRQLSQVCGFGTTDDCFDDMNLDTGFGNSGYAIEINIFKVKSAVNVLYHLVRSLDDYFIHRFSCRMMENRSTNRLSYSAHESDGNFQHNIVIKHDIVFCMNISTISPLQDPFAILELAKQLPTLRPLSTSSSLNIAPTHLDSLLAWLILQHILISCSILPFPISFPY